MMLDTSKNILIVGLGLIGGSYAKALRKLGFKISAIKAETISNRLAGQVEQDDEDDMED